MFLLLFQFAIDPFPIQVRLAYLAWVCAGTYIPGMEFLMWSTTAGLTANLVVGYCPLARLMTLALPWRRESFLGPSEADVSASPERWEGSTTSS